PGPHVLSSANPKRGRVGHPFAESPDPAASRAIRPFLDIKHSLVLAKAGHVRGKALQRVCGFACWAGRSRPVSNHGARIETAKPPSVFAPVRCRPVSNHGARIETSTAPTPAREATSRPVSNHGARIETSIPKKLRETMVGRPVSNHGARI